MRVKRSRTKRSLAALVIALVMTLSSTMTVFSYNGYIIGDEYGYTGADNGYMSDDDYGNGYDEYEDPVVVHPEVEKGDDVEGYLLPLEAPIAPMAAGIMPLATITVNNPQDLIDAVDNAAPFVATTIILGGSITVTDDISIDWNQNITLNTGGHTLNIITSGVDTLLFIAGSLTVEGGGTVNVMATDAENAVDIQGGSLNVVIGSELNISNTHSLPLSSPHPIDTSRGLRVLNGEATIRGNITVDGNYAVGLRARHSTVNVFGDINTTGVDSVGIYTSGELSVITVSGTVTGPDPDRFVIAGTPSWGYNPAWGRGPDTITVGGQPVTPSPSPWAPPPAGGGGIVTVPHPDIQVPSIGRRTPNPAPGTALHAFHTGMSFANRAAIGVRRTASNDTTADSIIQAIRANLPPGVTAEWSSRTPFRITPATDDTPGRITGLIIVTVSNYSSAINFNIVIPELLDE